jgi:uncharacterized protein YjbI with pentapeptide repeats
MQVEVSSSGHRSKGEKGVHLKNQRLRGRVLGGVPVQSVKEGCYDGARIKEALLVGACERSSFRDAILEAPRAEEGARVVGCEMEGAHVDDGALKALALETSRLMEARVQNTRFGTVLRCDLRRARLENCSVERLVSCRMDRSILVKCELGDVSHSSFRGARLQDCTIGAAEGADFRGARGLTAEMTEHLGTLGARCGRRAPRSFWAIALGVVMGGAWLATAPPEEKPLETKSLVPTQDMRTASQHALVQLRERLAHAHDTMVETGAINRTWPTIRDLQQNRYDMDGDGPGESWDLIATTGLPQNLLTRAQGGAVLFCKEDPVQEDLSGVDTDWYYCELNGRLLAAAGGSGEATLNW